MSTFISILGKIDNENDQCNSVNNKNVTDLSRIKSSTENKNNDNNNNWNVINVKNFRDFYNGNNENGLQDLLRLFQGLGLALGERANYIKKSPSVLWQRFFYIFSIYRSLTLIFYNVLHKLEHKIVTE